MNILLKFNSRIRYSTLLGICLGLVLTSQGQTSEVNGLNTPGGGGMDFLGWDNTVNSTLEIRHDTPGENIIFGTSNLERMRIKTKAMDYEK